MNMNMINQRLSPAVQTVVTLGFLLVSYFGLYYIGYNMGDQAAKREFAEYVRETSKTLDEATKTIKETSDFIDQLNNYECRPKNETFPSQSYPREKIRG